MKEIKERNACVQIKTVDRTLPLEFNTELSLPDYRSEISRLLWIKPTFLSPTRFVGGGNADFSGRVCYQVLYADPDGKLCSAEVEDNYSFSVPVPAGESMEFSVETFPDAVIGRVVAPRKLTIRSRLHAQVYGYTEKDMSDLLSQEEMDSAALLGDTALCGKLMTGMGDALELSEEFPATDAEGRSLEASLVHGEVFVPEVTTMSGAVRCRGEVVATVLCNGVAGEGESTLPSTIVRRMPFECEIPMEGVCAEDKARVTASVAEIRAFVEEGKATVAVRVIPVAEVQHNELVYYIKDMFFPGAKTECRFCEQRLWTAEHCGNRNYSLSEAIVPNDGFATNGATVIDAYAEAMVKERILQEKNTVFVGEIHCHVLYQKSGEYGTSEINMPFRVPVEGDCKDCITHAKVPVCHARVENDRVRIDAELMLCLRAFSEYTVRSVGEVIDKEQLEDVSADVELCYPLAQETLWHIAKRYAVLPEEIATANGLCVEAPDDPNGLKDQRYLLIPSNYVK